MYVDIVVVNICFVCKHTCEKLAHVKEKIQHVECILSWDVVCRMVHWNGKVHEKNANFQ